MEAHMCRNIKTLYNFEPPATDEEIRAASLQFVRKLSGFNTPSKANSAAFDAAIEEVFWRGAGSWIPWRPMRRRAIARPKRKRPSAAPRSDSAPGPRPDLTRQAGRRSLVGRRLVKFPGTNKTAIGARTSCRQR
jgi:hypothetical protein